MRVGLPHRSQPNRLMRPRDLTGFQMYLAAKVALHNFCIWLNLSAGRAPLTFTDLIQK